MRLKSILSEITNEILNEVRPSGILYHYINPEALIPMLEENVMKVDYGKKRNPNKNGKKEFGISFTRTKVTSKDVLPFARKRPVRLVFNRKKLSDDFEIVPRGKTTGRDEREETVFTKEITNVKKYIDRIDVSAKRMIELDTGKLSFTNPDLMVASEIDDLQDLLPKNLSGKVEDDLDFNDIKKIFDRYYTERYGVQFNLLKSFK